uniref:Response regulatory domain-containing protein n=1 Tax=Oryza glumipatula TaxID=40148 RepID=A0A0E0AUV9_9ORYZ
MGEKTEYRDGLVENAFMGLFARKMEKYAVVSSSGGKEKKKSSWACEFNATLTVPFFHWLISPSENPESAPLNKDFMDIKPTVRIMIEHDVNMIVSDYCMPNMTGYDLLMEVEKSPKLAHLPVVIASSDNIPERIRKCLDGGAKDYILKPVKIVDVPRILNYI